jgi:hypothetical protein
VLAHAFHADPDDEALGIGVIDGSSRPTEVERHLVSISPQVEFLDVNWLL